MAVIVPCHIGPSSLPTQPSLDIALGAVPAPDPATPRAIVAAAAAAAALITSTTNPAVTTSSPEPEYRLSSKRKSSDGPDGDLDVSLNSKRLKSTDVKDEDDAFFVSPDVPVIVPTDPIIIDDDADLDATLQQALALLASTQADPQPALAPSEQQQQQTPVIVSLVENVSPPPPSSARARLSPLSRFSSLPDDSVDEEQQQQPIIRRPSVSPPPPRTVEPPLWKLACHARVQHIINTHGIGAIRETIRQEGLRRPPSDLPTPSGSTTRQPVDETPLSKCSDLCLHIYTPSNFVASDNQSSDHLLLERNTELEDEVEDEVDMSFDLDDDESDSEEDTDEDSDGGSQPHDLLLDVKLELESSHSESDSTNTSPLSSPPLPQTIPVPIMIPTVPPLPHMLSSYSPPPLPRISSVPVWCLRAYPEPGPCGTPARVAPWARGVLSRECLRAQAQALIVPTSSDAAPRW